MNRETFLVVLMAIEVVFGLAFFVALGLGLLDGVILNVWLAIAGPGGAQ